MNASEYETQNSTLVSWTWIDQSNFSGSTSSSASPLKAPVQPTYDPLKPVRRWLDNVSVNNAEFARSVCKFIPAQCPFERTVKLFGRPVLHIPPMCKLNPLYEEVVALRFRALCYLADECGEDVTPYC